MSPFPSLQQVHCDDIWVNLPGEPQPRGVEGSEFVDVCIIDACTSSTPATLPARVLKDPRSKKAVLTQAARRFYPSRAHLQAALSSSLLAPEALKTPNPCKPYLQRKPYSPNPTGAHPMPKTRSLNPTKPEKTLVRTAERQKP